MLNMWLQLTAGYLSLAQSLEAGGNCKLLFPWTSEKNGRLFDFTTLISIQAILVYDGSLYSFFIINIVHRFRNIILLVWKIPE